MSTAQMHQEHSGATPARPEVRCDGCGARFVQKRRWQRFCGAKCRTAWHVAMTPEAMHRRITELEKKVADLEGRLQAPLPIATQEPGIS